MRISMVWFAVLAAAGACSAGPAEETRWHDKPSAPVQVTLEARPLGGDVYEVTLRATPRVDVPQLELRIDGEALAVGATQASQTRTMTRRIHLDGAAGRELAGGATVPVGGHRRSRAAVITLGAVSKPAAAPTKIITLGDGTAVEEVR